MTYLNWNQCVKQLSIQKEQLGEIIQKYGQTPHFESMLMGWISITLSVLERCFSANDRRIKQFENIGKSEDYSVMQIAEAYHVLMGAYIHEIERGLIEPSPTTEGVDNNSSLGSLNVFIVHGRAEAIVEEVAVYIGSLGFTPRVFKREPDRGNTIIEKLERISSEVGFAIVILTGDDFGGIKTEFPDEPKSMIVSRLKGFIPARLSQGGGTVPGMEGPLVVQTLKRAASIMDPLQPRARQNVIFELGFFFGLRGRDNVCVLYERGVELPSDVQGLMYKPLDEAASWKDELERELTDWRQRIGARSYS